MARKTAKWPSEADAKRDLSAVEERARQAATRAIDTALADALEGNWRSDASLFRWRTHGPTSARSVERASHSEASSS